MLLWGLWQPANPVVEPCLKQFLAASVCGGQCWHLGLLPSVGYPSPRMHTTGNVAKALTVGTVAAQGVKGLAPYREQLFFHVCVFISQSCWTVLRCTQYLFS